MAIGNKHLRFNDIDLTGVGSIRFEVVAGKDLARGGSLFCGTGTQY